MLADFSEFLVNNPPLTETLAAQRFEGDFTP
nr:MAG TPA: hypothetical protein [Caudoviricetes sp.]